MQDRTSPLKRAPNAASRTGAGCEIRNDSLSTITVAYVLTFTPQ